MITSPSKRPVSVKSLAGSPVLKPEVCIDDFDEELRSISNDLPPANFDLYHFLSPQSLDQDASKTSAATCPVAANSHVPGTDRASKTGHPRAGFINLPFDLHEQILEQYFGPKVCVNCSSTTSDSSRRSWSRCPRFTRRRQMTDLALVCRSWRQLIQARIYRRVGTFSPNRYPDLDDSYIIDKSRISKEPISAFQHHRMGALKLDLTGLA